ncbi:MAG: quinoprotein dehydrogenase-associated SoxYZ-like carrier [Acetobacteraceae bacterium]|nr:quinoprotein dehydrogenase-associated SoxYZ-like carrier [Acetobacteraceae bacterium]
MGARNVLPRRQALIAALALGASARRGAAQSPVSEDPWPSLATQIFGGRAIRDGSDLLALDAPDRAEDAALVPISVHSILPATDPRRVRAITLVIDENPSPVAARIVLGPSWGPGSLATRVRVDAYTNLHAVAETADGRLHAVQRFVKAAGGCSAPAAKQQADAIPLGTMRFREFPPVAGVDTREVQLMVWHPNHSGMQMDQITRLYVPAHFITAIRFWQGDELLLEIEAGISISENPTFRFDVRPNGALEFRAEVQDSEGGVFKQNWPAAPV